MENNLSTEQLTQLMSLLSCIQQPAQGENSSGSNNPAAMLERAAPFIDGKWRRNIAFIGKLLEMQQYMTSLTVMTQSRGDGIQMLKAVRSELDEQKQSIVDMLIKCMELKTIAQSFQK